jgi:hypothetical protein
MTDYPGNLPAHNPLPDIHSAPVYGTEKLLLTTVSTGCPFKVIV